MSTTALHRAIAAAEAKSDRLAERVAELEADKSICLAAINFALQCDGPDAFLRCWNDGSADVDEEWKDWQEFKANLVLHGAAAKQPLARSLVKGGGDE